MHAWEYTCACACVCVCVCLRLRVHVRLCMHVCMHIVVERRGIQKPRLNVAAIWHLKFQQRSSAALSQCGCSKPAAQIDTTLTLAALSLAVVVAVAF